MAVDVQPPEIPEAKVKKSKKFKSKDKETKEGNAAISVGSTTLGGLYVTAFALFLE